MIADTLRLIYHRIFDFLSIGRGNRSWLLIIFGLIHAVILLVLFVNLSQRFYSDPGGLERYFAFKILNGQVPYVDFTSEYPPLAFLSFLIPAVAAQTPLTYSIAYAAEILVLDLIALLLLKNLSARLNISLVNMLTVYTLFLFAIGPLIVIRYDLLPAVLVLASLWAFVSGRQKTAWAMLALGVMAKLYPIILVPLFALHYIRHKQYRELAKGSAVFVALLIILALPWLVLNADGFLDMLRYHADRGLESESSYASILMVGQFLGVTEVQGEFSFGSWNVTSPLANSLAQVSPYITVGLLLILYIVYARKRLGRQSFTSKIGTFDSETANLTVRHSLLAILIFMLSNKVLSAQYLIWICPLLPLISGRWRIGIWLLFMAAAAITQYVFPYHFFDFQLGEPFPIAMMATRNFLLLVMIIFLMLPVHSRKKRAELLAADLEPAGAKR